MKIVGQILTKRQCLLIPMLIVIMSAATDLMPQDLSSQVASNQQEAVKSSQTQQHANRLEQLKKPIADWINAHTELTFLLGIVAFIITWFKDRLKRAITHTLRPLFGRFITWVFIRFGAYHTLLNKYRQTLQKKLQEVGLTQQLLGEGVDLEKNYISIELSKEEYKHLEGDESAEADSASAQGSQAYRRTEEPKMERVDVHKVLTDEKNYDNRIAIIGDPGSGKTTLQQYLTYQCTKGEGVRLIPALITLTAYVQHAAMSIRAYLKVLFEENGFPKAESYIERQLKKGSFLILLDGFDEVEIDKRNELRQQIKAFANHPSYLQNKIVITSRPVRDAVFENFRHLEVMPLTSKQRQAFLESKIDDNPKSDFTPERCHELFTAIEEHDRIRKLAENPLLLTFLYHVYKYNLELPRRRVELYRLSVNLMLDWDMETNRPTHIMVKDRDAKKEVLKKVAYYYHTHQKRELSEAELFAQVKSYLPDSLKEKFTAKALIGEIENSSGILRHRTAESYQFIHLTFQEYLTADYISDNREDELPKLITRVHNPWWREVTLLLASVMGNATPLVYRILDHGRQINEEAHRLSGLFIAFNCLFEAEVDADARNQVLDTFVKLPYHQVIDVIQSIVGPIEPGNEELETLFVNILNSPHESVRAWGLGALDRYPQVAEDSERLTKRRKAVSEAALRQLPDEIQEHILEVLPLDRIAREMWTALTAEAQTVMFDYLDRLYTQCSRTVFKVATHQKLLLSQSAQLVRFLVGALALNPHHSATPLSGHLRFSPDRKEAPGEPAFTDDFVAMWPSGIPTFINLLRSLILTLYPTEDGALVLAEDLARTRALDWAHAQDWNQSLAWGRIRSLARALCRARELGPVLNEPPDLALGLALDVTLERALDRIQVLEKARDLKRVKERARDRAMDWTLNPTWSLALELVQNADRARDRAKAQAMDLVEDLDQALALALTLGQGLKSAWDREAIEFLGLAQDLVLACAILHAQEQIRDELQHLGFIQRFLETTGSQDSESSWYIITLSQQSHAALYVKSDGEALIFLQRLWEKRSENLEIAPYQCAFFANLGTYLHTLGVALDGTFFEDVLEESADPKLGLVPRMSYLLHQIVVQRATTDEQQEFRKCLQTGASEMEAEWLQLSGLSAIKMENDVDA